MSGDAKKNNNNKEKEIVVILLLGRTELKFLFMGIDCLNWNLF